MTYVSALTCSYLQSWAEGGGVCDFAQPERFELALVLALFALVIPAVDSVVSFIVLGFKKGEQIFGVVVLHLTPVLLSVRVDYNIFVLVGIICKILLAIVVLDDG
jgi:hypothetical protein